ncbi:hypothetical protein AB990_14215 [Alkalihalobacillus pseudalcaliphilus]|nr:hypothetical protein AB990_14215 [Alkalihalobacillus pseudalcaliphilus]
MPDPEHSGKGIGVIIIDTLKSDEIIKYLGDKLLYITVNDDFTIEFTYPAYEQAEEIDDYENEHGLLTLLSLSHQPIEVNGRIHTGISPAATFLVLNHGAFREGEQERLKMGIDWLLERKERFNYLLWRSKWISDFTYRYKHLFIF